jgi:exopolyphosphatase/guanosine-5'-triphosphate,3'-diphosphate pyrophosphatase
MGDCVALIDLGSNAVRLLLAELQAAGGARVVEQERVQTRLGAAADGLLCERAVAQTLAAARGFLDRTRHRQPRVLAIATASARNAPNREVLLAPLRAIDGLELRVLSCAEEARLGAEAALRLWPAVHDGVIADLGGGSLQLTLLDASTPVYLGSVALGVARLTRRFLHHDPPSPIELARLRCEVRVNLRQVLPHALRIDRLIVLGGTTRALLRSARGRPGGQRNRGDDLDRHELESLRALLQPLALPSRRALKFVDPQRVDVMVAGAIVLEELMHVLRCPRLRVCPASVRDGVLWREADACQVSARLPARPPDTTAARAWSCPTSS